MIDPNEFHKILRQIMSRECNPLLSKEVIEQSIREMEVLVTRTHLIVFLSFRIFTETNPTMMATTTTSSESCIDVRFSKLYAIIVMLMSVAPLIVAVDTIISLKQELFQGSNFIIPSLAILLGLLIFFAGITLQNRRYLRLDKENNRN